VTVDSSDDVKAGEPARAKVRWRARAARQFRYPLRWLSFLASGVTVILVFPGLSLSYLAWFALVPAMVLFLRAPTTREAVARGWWFGAGYLIAMLYWMAPEIGPGLLLLGAAAGWLWSPFAVAVNHLLRPGGAWWHWPAAFAVVPSCWLIPEWARSYQGLGGPWDLYGASQWQHPAVLALASVGGVWLVTVALLLANVALVVLLGALRPTLVLPGGTATAGAGAGAGAGTGAGARGWSLPRAAAGVAALVAAAGAGPLAFALTPAAATVRQVNVALVQPGVVDNPVQRTDASEHLTDALSSDGYLGGVKPDLIVWGESSIPDDLTGSSQADQALLRQIEALSKADDAEILVNQDTTTQAKGHEKWAVLVSPAGVQGTYVKTRLVPFGEYIPFRQQIGFITSVSKAASSNMVPGTGAHTLTVDSPEGSSGPLTIGVLICFESAFPDMSRVETDQGAQVIVYQSSTSTFQGTWGPDQQASLAAVRAAETGRPVVQTALTGDTVAFDARGRQLAWLGQDASGAVTVTLDLPAQASRTFCDQAGDYIMWAGVGITGLAALVMLLRRRHFLADSTGAADNRTAEYDPDTGKPVRS
jgi:apolipoprotein N-acyltransferase